jgi:murein DD-endopeptidase MepM/ murein hydrolase activator NlpD
MSLLGRLVPGWPRARPAGPRESWTLEVQIHPSDIRRKVRYLFLSRVQVTLWSVVVLAYLYALACALAFAPGVIGGVLNGQEYQTLTAERARQGERLQALVRRMAQIERRAAGLNARLDKIFLAYGLPRARTRGYGGYPFRPVPGSIYASAIERGNRLQARAGERLGVLDAFLREVREFERANPDQVRATPALCPLRGSEFVLTSTFGRRRSPFTREFEVHTGLDLAAPRGTPIHAPADGVVAFAGTYPMARSPVWWRFGNLVILRHGDRFVTVFGHCDELRVRTGQRVRQGDFLATVGSTGWSTSPHVHYEVRRRMEDGEYRPVDPVIYILDRRWQNEERLLVRAAREPAAAEYEPLPPGIARPSRRNAG